MNEAVNLALVELIARVLAGVDGVVEFSREQLPEVLEQLLIWNCIKSATFFLAGVIVILCVIKGVLYLNTHLEKMEYNDVMAAVTILVLSLIAGIVMVLCNLVWLQILIAPKVYLLEYAADIVKGVK